MSIATTNPCTGLVEAECTPALVERRLDRGAGAVEQLRAVTFEQGGAAGIREFCNVKNVWTA